MNYNKTLIILLLGMFLISFTSSLELDNVKQVQDLSKGGYLTIGEKQITDYIKKYPQIEIKNTFGLGKTLFKGALTKHTEVCSSDCESELEIYLANDGVLIDDVLWKRSFDDSKTWIDWTGFTNWKVLIENKNRYIEQPTYKTICEETGKLSLNGTAEIECSQIKTGTETIDTGEWINYELGSSVKAGNYKFKIEGSKKSSTILDWQIKTQGKVINEWATWGSIAGGDDAEVILNSPADASTSLNNLVTFNASANVTGGANLTNMSLCSDISGSWECGDSVDFNDDVITLFDDFSTNTAGNYTCNAWDGACASGIVSGGEFISETSKYNTRAYSHSQTINLTKDQVIQGRFKSTGDDWGSIGLVVGNDLTKDNQDVIQFTIKEDGGDAVVLRKYVGGAQSVLNTTAGSYTTNTYYNLKLVYFANNQTWYGYEGGVLKGNAVISDSSIYSSTAKVGFLFRAYTSGYNQMVDDFNITKIPFVTSSTQKWTKIIPAGTTTWNSLACDSDGDCGYEPNNFTLSLEATAPTIETNVNQSILYYEGENITLNYSITDNNLETCLYSYNGNNNTITCGDTEVNITTTLDALEIIVYANDTAGNNANPVTLTLSLDATAPTIEINAGNETQDYGNQTINHTINFTITDDNLDECWFEYNGTNSSDLGCSSGVLESFNFTLQHGKNNATIYANDTVGNLQSQFIEWNYKVFENSRTHNTSTYETAREGYTINLTSDSSLTAVKLWINETPFSMINQGSGIWHYSRDTPVELLGSKSINFSFTYLGSQINSTYSTTQSIQSIQFGLCNTTITNDFLNISFKDENTLEYINASIPTSIFTYYLGEGSVNKTYEYINTTDNFNYSFCFTPTDKTLKVMPYLQYKQGTSYPQRIWQPLEQSYTQAVTNKILYLLSPTSGRDVTYQVLDSTGNAIHGVDVTATREVEGEDILVGAGQTDASGGITLWINRDFLHTLSFSKDGYISFSLNQFPTETQYTVKLASNIVEGITDYTKGVTRTILPRIGTTLQSNENHNFNLTLYSSIYDLDLFGFSLYGDNNLIGSNTSETANTTIYSITNISNYSDISMTFYWIINGTVTNGTVKWNGFDFDDGTEFSIKNLFTHLSLYASAGMFGLNSNSLNLIVFMIIILGTGLVSYKFSIQSPAQISVIVFALTFLFDVGLGLITFKAGEAIQYFPTIFIGIIMVSLIVREMI